MLVLLTDRIDKVLGDVKAVLTDYEPSRSFAVVTETVSFNSALAAVGGAEDSPAHIRGRHQVVSKMTTAIVSLATTLKTRDRQIELMTAAEAMGASANAAVSDAETFEIVTSALDVAHGALQEEVIPQVGR